MLRIAAWALLVVCAGCLALVFLPVWPGSKTAPAALGAEKVVVTRSRTPQRPAPSGGTTARLSASSQAVFVEPTQEMRRLVDQLVSLQPAGGVLTEEQVAAWRQNLWNLIQQGANAVPAIREFLAKNIDLEFGNGKATLGYTSARAAMIDALSQIGGPMAIAALDEVLQTTAIPREIAFITKDLEKLEPGTHQQASMEAARQTLALAAGGGLPGKDVAPLFQLMQTYGGPEAVADLENGAGRWNIYSMIALSQLPDGAGIPSLARLADSGTDAAVRSPALHMLAQVAGQSPEARDALVGLVRQDKLSAADWLALTPLLAGNRQFFQDSVFDNPVGGINPNELRSGHLPDSNQNYYTAPAGALTRDQIQRQQALIDQLLAATSDPNATRALQQARELLARRAALIASAGSGS